MHTMNTDELIALKKVFGVCFTQAELNINQAKFFLLGAFIKKSIWWF